MKKIAAHIKGVIEGALGDIYFSGPVDLPSDCLDNTTITNFYNIMLYVDDMMKRPYNIADFIKIFSTLVNVWHRESTNCGINDGIQHVKQFCFKHGGCNILQITFRASEYAMTIAHHWQNFEKFFGQMDLHNAQLAGEQLGEIIKLVFALKQESMLSSD